jgi:hypothetical protein
VSSHDETDGCLETGRRCIVASGGLAVGLLFLSLTLRVILMRSGIDGFVLGESTVDGLTMIRTRVEATAVAPEEV